MVAGNKQIVPIPLNVLWDDYYENLHLAYNNMRAAYADSGLTQDDISVLLDVDKSLISKRLNGTENLTLKSMSHMGTAMDCRLLVAFIPYQYVGTTNYYVPTPHHARAAASSNTGTLIYDGSIPIPAGKSKELEPT